jgi:hypothetical protein
MSGTIDILLTQAASINLVLEVKAPIILQATQSGLAVGPKGDDGDPGPNEITTDTDTDISGILVGDTGKVRVAEPGDMPEDATHRTVTDAEKLAWNTSIGLTLGETSTTAYRGDRGKTAYDHSQTAHAPVALSGAKSSATDAGTFGDVSLTDDYVYYCAQTGTAGNAIWKKSVMFQT